MDNVVQKIKLNDITPSNFSSNSDTKDLEELAISIKNYGILEPLLLRPKNGKYEIILGNKRYQAAKMIGLQEVPALVKNVDDEVFKQYTVINQMQRKFAENNSSINQNSNLKENNQQIPEEKSMTSNNNQTKRPPNIKIPSYNSKNRGMNHDIVNLSELNKEEEREDRFMNNGQLNNNGMNNNLGANPINNSSTIQEPTFGGRFFPSLEDEPTNMDMGGISINQPMQPPLPSIDQNIPHMNNQPNNNFIDLTDTSIEKEANPSMNQAINENPTITPPPQEFIPNNITSPINNQLNQNPPIMNNQPSMVPPIDNIINLDNLQNNNQPLSSMNINANQVNPIMEEVNQDFQPKQVEQPQTIPQFDMSQNVAPTYFNQPQPMNNMTDISQFNRPEPSMVTNKVEMPSISNNSTVSLNPEIPQMTANPIEEIPQFPQKEVQPVVNTIKSVATSLEQFGYKINIIDEDGMNTYKITIEIEK